MLKVVKSDDFQILPIMNAISPVINHISVRFFIFLAFFLEGFLIRNIEDTINPTSVIITNGINQFVTIPQIHGKGLIPTAISEKVAAIIAAIFSPFVTAIVFMLCFLSPSMSTIPFVISLPVFERNTIVTNSNVEVSICPVVKPP